MPDISARHDAAEGDPNPRAVQVGVTFPLLPASGDASRMAEAARMIIRFADDRKAIPTSGNSRSPSQTSYA